MQAGFGSYDTTKRELLRGHRRRARARLDRGRPGSTARASRRAPATTPIAATRTRRSRRPRARNSARRTRACAAWYASGTTEYSDFFVTPVDQDFENTALARDGGIRADARPGRRGSSVAHAIDDLEQNQSRRLPRHEAQHGRLAERLRAVGATARSRPACCGRTRKPTPSPSALPYAADTTTSQFYLQDQADFGPHRLLLGGRLHGSRDFRRPRDLERGIRLAHSRAARSSTLAAGTAFRAPDATDLYGFGGNPDLEPEESQSFEVELAPADRRAAIRSR